MLAPSWSTGELSERVVSAEEAATLGALHMNPDFDVRTSKTLLGKLRVFEDQRAWSQFTSLYLPMIQTWGRRFGLSQDDVEELTSRLLSKLLEALPRFDYDPEKGSFRGWLKTITQRELITFARERRRRLPGDEATGRSAVYDQLREHADDVDHLITGLHDQSEGLLRSLQEAMQEIRDSFQGEEQKSWEMFRRIVLANEQIDAVAAEFGLSYHATAMRVQRIKKKVRSRALELAIRRGPKP
jgi:RNA polymerase sigma-70 factor (ECF subfamily)